MTAMTASYQVVLDCTTPDDPRSPFVSGHVIGPMQREDGGPHFNVQVYGFDDGPYIVEIGWEPGSSMKHTEVCTDAPAAVAEQAFTRAGVALACSGHHVIEEAHYRLVMYWWDWMDGVNEESEEVEA